MSGDLDQLEKDFKINELADLGIEELRELYSKAFETLIEEKIKYEEYECKFKHIHMLLLLSDRMI